MAGPTQARQYSSGRSGGDADYQTERSKGIREERGIVLGIVKTNAHPSAMGVLQVFVPTFGNTGTQDSKKLEDDPTKWRQVRYATPFYSRTELQGSGNNPTSVKNAGGIIYPCPDVGTSVLCFFPEGRNQDGFWFACAPDVYMMQTLPESAMTSNFEKAGTEVLVRHNKAPGLEFNDKDNDVNKLTNFNKIQRGVDIDRAIQLKVQGLDQDEVRGLTTSNAMRETPTEVFGISTKGRKTDKDGVDIKDRPDIIRKLASGDDLSTADARAVEGKIARKHGHAFVMDDGDLEGNNNLVRLRSAAGHQVLLHDTEGVIYISNSQGNVWVQIDSNGQLDIYSETNINLRSNSMNFHADESIKFHAGEQIQMVSGGSLTLEGKKLAHMYSDGDSMIYGGKSVNIKSDSVLNMSGSSSTNIQSSGPMNLQASLISLNGSASPAKKQNSVKIKELDDVKTNKLGFYVEDKKAIKTTVDRVPTHEPYNQHGSVTQVSILKTVSVTDVPDSGNLSVAKPKQPVSVSNQGLDAVKSRVNNFTGSSIFI